METAYFHQTTMRDYMKVLFRQKVVFLACVITVLITVIIGLFMRTPVYESQVKMLISAEKQVEATYYRELLGYRNVEASLTQSEIVNSNPVIERAVKASGLYQRQLDYEKTFASLLKKPLIILNARLLNWKLRRLTPEQKQGYLFRITVEDLKRNTRVEPIRDTNMFTIKVKDFSPVGSAILANIVSRAYVIFDLEQQLAEQQLKYGEKHLSVMQLKDSIEKMAKKLTGQPLPDMEAIGPASVKIIEQAQVPFQPIGLPKSLTFILAVLMSIFLGAMLAFSFEYLDQTFKSPQDVEMYLNLDYLGSVPKNATLNAYNILADQIFLLMKDRKLKSLLLGAVLPAEGVTTTIVNLGTYLSKNIGQRVLIIDANFRNPSMHKLFKSADVQGLSDVLEGKASLDKAVKDLGSNLFVLVAGKTALNPVTLLESHHLPEVIKEAKERYDIVLMDCAALNDFKDGLVISSYIDGMALVVNEGKTRRQVVKAAIDAFEQVKAKLLGVILNNRTFPIPQGIYQRV